MPSLDNKISNVFGTALPQWIKDQIAIRSNYTYFGATKGQEDLNAIYRANKTAWIRVVSSININADKDTALLNDIDYFKYTLGISDLSNAEDLAKKYVLFGGTSQYLDPSKSVLRSGLGKDGAYGMLGDKEIQTSGYRPMPGITDATIDTQGRLGSIRMATINFKVWSKAELDIIDALYFKLGYTMLIEWGHTVYVKSLSEFANKNQFDYTEFNALNPFEKGMTKETINLKIAQNVRATGGNYDGMLGIVTNFTFSYNQDSGYDCMIKVIGLGALGGSLKINNPSNLPTIVNLQIRQYINLITSKKEQEEQEKRNKLLEEQFAEEKKKLEVNVSGDSYYEDIYNGWSNDPGFSIINSSDSSNTFRLNANLQQTVKDLILLQSDSSLNRYTFYFNNKFNKDQFAIPQVRNFLVATDFAAEDTKINLNLDILNNKFNVNDKFFNPNFPNFGIQNSINNLSQNKSTLLPSLTSDKDFTYILSFTDTLYYPQFLTYNDTIGKDINYGQIQTENNKNVVTFIQYSVNEVNYRADVTINLSDQGINLLDTLNGSIPYQSLKIHDLISDQLKDYNTPWKVDSIGKYNYFARSFHRSFHFNDATGIYVDTSINNNDYKTIGLNLYKQIDIEIPNARKKTTPLPSGEIISEPENVKYHLNIGLFINDVSMITDFEQKNAKKTKESQLLSIQNQLKNLADQNTKDQSKEVPIDQTTLQKQISSALTYQSNLELAIKSIELYALTKAVTDNGLNIGSKINAYQLSSKENRKFIDGIFKYGIYNDFLSNLFDKKINDDFSWNSGDNAYINNLIGSNSDIKMRLFAKYGFNTAYMSAKADGEDYNKRLEDSIPPVDYDALTTVYVVPYDINQSIEGGSDIVHPVYVQLGFLLMILNSMCTIYESKSSDNNSGPIKPRPVVYIDYNPETNFCLTNPVQLTTDAFNFLIPMQASQAQYATLFPSGSIYTDDKSGISIKAPIDGDHVALFNPENDDAISKKLPEFRAKIGGSDAYRGKTMKILVSCEYILNIIKDFSANDGMNDVYLKPFLEQLIKDLNKSLGGINVFRISYDDPSNCFAIVDDQIQPLAPGEKEVGQTATDQIPLFGVKSIAKSINIQTEIGSNLANMVAISANSNPSDQSANSINASSFGFINNSFLDRYIPVKKELTPEEIKTNKAKDQQKQEAKYDSELITAQKFNDTIISYYGKNAKPNKDSVGQATNYYINRMSKKMNQEGPTRASAMIPVSVNFTTDGISGFNIGQAFTIPQEILPYTYSARQTPTIKSVQNPTENAKVAFATVGINHVIQGNVWDTSIKGSMILIKDQGAFNGETLNTTYNKQTIDIVNIENNALDIFNSTINYSNYSIAKSKNYSNISFASSKDSTPETDKIKDSLLKDINDAAKSAGVQVTITTAITGHKSHPGTSRHESGNAVDISIIDGKSVSRDEKVKISVDKFVSELEKLSYKKNQENGNPKSVLTFGYDRAGTHDNHIHVSNLP